MAKVVTPNAKQLLNQLVLIRQPGQPFRPAEASGAILDSLRMIADLQARIEALEATVKKQTTWAEMEAHEERGEAELRRKWEQEGVYLAGLDGVSLKAAEDARPATNAPSPEPAAWVVGVTPLPAPLAAEPDDTGTQDGPWAVLKHADYQKAMAFLGNLADLDDDGTEMSQDYILGYVRRAIQCLRNDAPDPNGIPF